MNREDQISYCSKCKNRKMDFNRGLLCGLTNEFADFEESCPDFLEDNSALPNESISVANAQITIADSAHKPNKYWNYLGYFFLAAIGISMIDAGLYIWEIIADEISDYWYISGQGIFYFSLWTFIGWETGHLKNGLIAGGIFFIFIFLIKIIPTPDLFIIYYIPILLSSLYYGYFSLRNTRQIWVFALACLLLVFGTYNTGNFNGAGLTENIDSVMRNVFGINTDFGIGFITWYSDAGEYGTTYSFDFFFIDIFRNALLFLGITYVFNVLQNKQNFRFNLVELGRRTSQGRMTLYVLALYVGVSCLALGIMGRVVVFFTWVWKNDYGITYTLDDYISWLMTLLMGILILVAFTALYRKILLEYYLERNQPISWNFYFGQIPIIGFFVWIYNLTSFTIPANLTREKLSHTTRKDNSLKTFLMLLYGVYVVVILGISMNIGGRMHPAPLAILLIGFMIYGLYLFNEIGVYIVLGIQFLAFLIILAALFAGLEFPMELIPSTLFWSMMLAFLVYPAFHLKTFKITLPGESV